MSSMPLSAILTRLVITLPVPSVALSPNARVHWRVKAKAVRKYRERAWAEALSALDSAAPPKWKRAAVTIYWHWKSQRPDPDNALASIKAGIDGLVSAGVLADDDGLTFAPIVFLRCDVEPRVELRVYAAERSGK